MSATIPDHYQELIQAKLDSVSKGLLQEVFELGRHEGFNLTRNSPTAPKCRCDHWDTGRTLGFIRKTMGGFALIGWRSVSDRLREPRESAVNESLFRWCPWCGCRARTT